MKLKIKIFLTVWVNYFAALICTFTSYITFYFFYLDKSISQSIFNVIFSTVEVLYFYLLFSVFVFVIDLLIPFKNRTKLNRDLLIEWLIISVTFLVGIIGAERYILIAFVIPYLISQFSLRKAKIEKIYQLHKEKDLVNQIN